MKQRSEEWFAARRNRVTASRAGAILGLDPEVSRDDVMREMVRDFHGAEREFTGNIATQWGVMNEPTASAMFELETGKYVQPAGFLTYADWLGASPDGFVDNDAVVELKCPFSLRAAQPPVEFKSLLGGQLEHYRAQVQVQMFVTQSQMCYFFQWAPFGSKLEVVEYDEAYIGEVIPELRAFYEEFLRAVDDPEQFLEAKRKVIDTPEAHRIMREYQEVCDSIGQAEDRKKELLEQMVKMSKGKNAIIAGKKLTCVEKAGSIKYAEVVKTLLPGTNLEPWRGKPSTFWKVS